MKKIKPIHPGEILLEEFMKPFNLSQNQVAKAINVSLRRINEIVNKKRAITTNTEYDYQIFLETRQNFG